MLIGLLSDNVVLSSHSKAGLTLALATTESAFLSNASNVDCVIRCHVPPRLVIAKFQKKLTPFHPIAYRVARKHVTTVTGLVSWQLNALDGKLANHFKLNWSNTSGGFG